MDFATQLVVSVTPIIVPLIIGAIKRPLVLLAGTWVKMLFPVFAVGLGVLADWLNLLITGQQLGPLGGAVLGLVAIALRDVVKELRELAS